MMTGTFQKFIGVFLIVAVLYAQGFAVQRTDSKSKMVEMDNQRLLELLKRIDPKIEGEVGSWTLHYEGIQVYVLTDSKADRMRIMTPVANTGDMDKALLYRILQANFDSALDARYAVSQDILWSVFLHPLSSLTDKDLFSGLGQVITCLATYGTTYSSGALIYQGGDSQKQLQKYYNEIMRKGLSA